MNKKIFSVLIIVSILPFAHVALAQKKINSTTTLDIMSFNIRMNYKDDGANNWQFRREYMTDLIRWHEPDLLGVQEAHFPQYIDMKSLLPEYKAFGPSEGRQGAESVAVFYLKSRMVLIDSGTFWLSKTPEKQSIGWDANLRRTVSWGAFKVKDSNKKVYFFVTHFDHKGSRAREESTKLLLQKVNQISGRNNAFIAGDFNLREDSHYYKMFINGFGSTPSFYDTRKLSEKYFGPAWTIQDFGLMPVEKRPRIDYIFSNKKVRVTHFHNISDQRGDVYPSDHNPQLSTVVF